MLGCYELKLKNDPLVLQLEVELLSSVRFDTMEEIKHLLVTCCGD